MATPSKAERLRAEADMEDAEAAFVKKKKTGQKRVDEARAKAFTAAKSYDEFAAANRAIKPALSAAEKAKHRALRQKYRLKYRKAVEPGEGAAPDTIGTAAEPQRPG